MYVYMLRCEDKSLYTGITADIIKRLRQHMGFAAGGAKYTRSHRVVFIEAIWNLESDKIARKLEYRLKRLSHTQKEVLLQNPDDISIKFADILSGLNIEYCDTGEYNKYFNFIKE